MCNQDIAIRHKAGYNRRRDTSPANNRRRDTSPANNRRRDTSLANNRRRDTSLTNNRIRDTSLANNRSRDTSLANNKKFGYFPPYSKACDYEQRTLMANDNTDLIPNDTRPARTRNSSIYTRILSNWCVYWCD